MNFTNNGESIRDINRGSREKKISQSQIMGKMVREKTKCMRGSKDLYSRILGGSEKESEGQTQLHNF